MWALLQSFLSYSFHFVSGGCIEDAIVLIMVLKLKTASCLYQHKWLDLQDYPGPCMSPDAGKPAFVIQGIPRNICLRSLLFRRISRLINPRITASSHPINTSLKFSNDKNNYAKSTVFFVFSPLTPARLPQVWHQPEPCLFGSSAFSARWQQSQCGMFC